MEFHREKIILLRVSLCRCDSVVEKDFIFIEILSWLQNLKVLNGQQQQIFMK